MGQTRTVGLEFLDKAPVRFQYSAPVAAPPEAVFREISAEPGLWAAWFPGLDEAGYESAKPHGVGSKRFARMGDVTYRETILAWDAPSRWAYRVDESTDDSLDALVEDWVVSAADDGSVVQWTFAAEPRAADLSGARDLIGSMFETAMTNLSNRLTGKGRALGPIGSEVVYENDRVRVWVMRLAPGEKSAVHRHDLDNLLIQISGDRIAALPEPDSEGPYRDYIAADVIPAAVVPVTKGGIETAYNLGKEPYLEVIVELKD